MKTADNRLPWSTKATDYVDQWNVEEYRKATAEALGFKTTRKMNELGRFDDYYVSPLFTDRVTYWQPDKDANQMLMVWEWLRKQGFPNRKIISNQVNYISHAFWYNNDDIKLASMKAFMEYYKTKQQ